MHMAELEVHTTQFEIVCLQAKLPLRLKPLTVPFAGAFACQVLKNLPSPCTASNGRSVRLAVRHSGVRHEACAQNVDAVVCQDALIAERTLEGGSPYVMDLDAADVYRCFFYEDV